MAMLAAGAAIGAAITGNSQGMFAGAAIGLGGSFLGSASVVANIATSAIINLASQTVAKQVGDLNKQAIGGIFHTASNGITYQFKNGNNGWRFYTNNTVNTGSDVFMNRIENDLRNFATNENTVIKKRMLSLLADGISHFINSQGCDDIPPNSDGSIGSTNTLYGSSESDNDAIPGNPPADPRANFAKDFLSTMWGKVNGKTGMSGLGISGELSSKGDAVFPKYNQNTHYTSNGGAQGDMLHQDGAYIENEYRSQIFKGNKNSLLKYYISPIYAPNGTSIIDPFGILSTYGPLFKLIHW
jgi:hypothetical protein